MNPLGNSIPVKGDGNGTVSLFKHNRQNTFGVNSSLLSDNSKDLARKWRKQLGFGNGKAQFLFHAEAHSLMRAYDKFGSFPKNVDIFVDRITCSNCKAYLPDLLKEMGVDELTIHQKNGKKVSIKVSCH